MQKITAQIAALYLGQKCLLKKVFRVGSIDAIELAHVRVRFDEGTPATAYYSIEDVKPILRPLSSLTEAEARELYELEYSPEKLPDNAQETALRWWREKDQWYVKTETTLIGSPFVWLKLLSWGIDLFGLIESGLALDATKMEIEKNDA